MVRIGVAGHRILTETRKVSAGIEEALTRIAQDYPNERLTVVSSLAEGSDRLVARHVLQRRGARLVALLPLSESEYMNDFGSIESKKEFSDLLAVADELIELPKAESRSLAYEAAGRSVLENCDVLVTVWDGQPAQGRGGTADVVEEARKRKLPIAWVHVGNRHPNTREPTSLGSRQGIVTYENLG